MQYFYYIKDKNIDRENDFLQCEMGYSVLHHFSSCPFHALVILLTPVMMNFLLWSNCWTSDPETGSWACCKELNHPLLRAT